MKLLFENWRKLLEGEVIQFPGKPETEIPEDDSEYINAKVINNIDDELGKRLAEIYGNTREIPFDKLFRLEELMGELDKLLTK